MAQLSPEYAKKDGAAAGGNGQQLCPFEQTKGAVHNLCLSTLNYECQHDWSGHVIKEYPLVIKNGDCGRFDHEGKFGVGSIGAVAYRGKDFDWLLAWSNRPSDKMCPVAKDQVYTEIAERGTCWNWDVIKEKLDKGGSSAKCHFKDYGAILKITQCPSANLEATISIINPF